MAIWKTFCRALENADTKRILGDQCPAMNRHAVFVFEDETLSSTLDAIEGEGEPEISMFPFPSMCLVHPNYIVAMSSPLMGDDKILSFDVIVFQGAFLADGPTDRDWSICKGVVSVGPCALLGFKASTCLARLGDRTREFNYEKGLGASFGHQPVGQDFVAETSAGLADARRLRDDLRAKGDTKAVARVEILIDKYLAHHAEAEDLAQKSKDAEIAVQDTADKLGRSIHDLVPHRFVVAMAVLDWINRPTHFTIQEGETPAKRGKNRNGRILRMNERPRFIVLEKAEITNRWHQSHGHGSTIPHLRRGHYRTLRHERYSTPGSRVWVRATHIKGQLVEWRDGGTVYRVL